MGSHKLQQQLPETLFCHTGHIWRIVIQQVCQASQQARGLVGPGGGIPEALMVAAVVVQLMAALSHTWAPGGLEAFWVKHLQAAWR